MAFILKHSQDIKPQKKQVINKKEIVNIEVNKKENNKKEIVNAMDKISMAEEIINSKPVKEIKRIKKDKGLIERTESSKTILTEDNKQLLVD